MAQTNVQAFSGDVAISSNLAVDTNTLFVDSVGNNVGIGTTNPVEKFHLYGSPIIQHSLTNSSVTNDSWHIVGTWDATGPDAVQKGGNLHLTFLGGALFGSNPVGKSEILARVGNQSAHRSILWKVEGEKIFTDVRMRRVGDVAYKYDICVKMRHFTHHTMRTECSRTTSFERRFTSTTEPSSADTTNVELGTTLPCTDTSGNLGIGTTSPGSTLDVVGDVAISSTLDVVGDVTISSNLAVDTNTLFVDSVGNKVGIGMTNPQATLDVAGSSSSGKSLQLRSGDHTGTDSSQIIFSFNNNPYNSSGFAHSLRTRHNAGADTGNAIDFWLWNTTDTTDISTLGNKRVMTIEGSGNVGIGTASPVGVNGGQRLEGSSSTGFEYIATRNDTIGNSGDFVGAYLFKNADTSGIEPHYAGMSSKLTGTFGYMDLRFHTNRANYEDDIPQMIIDADGNVGIGVTDPTYKLDVLDAIRIRGNYPTINFSEGAATANRPTFRIFNDGADQDDNNNYLAIQRSISSSAYESIIHAKLDGTVGIGTSSPSRALDVSTTGSIAFGNSISGVTERGLYWNDGSGYAIYRSGGNWSAPNYQQLVLNWATGIVLQTARGTYGRSFVGVDDRMSIGSSYYTTKSPTDGLIVQGKVGIGTTNPQATLDVVAAGGYETSGGIGHRNSIAVWDHIYMTNDGSNAFLLAGGCAAIHIGVANENAVDDGYGAQAYNGIKINDGATSVSAWSDVRMKTKIEALSDVIASIAKLDTIKYNLKSDFAHKKKLIGVVGQNIEKYFPDLVTETKDGEISVDYGELPVILLRAIQELQSDINRNNRAIIEDTSEDITGLLVSKNNDKYINTYNKIVSVPRVSLSNVYNDKRCIGVVSDIEKPDDRDKHYEEFDKISEKDINDTLVFIHSTGSGKIWVTDMNGNLEIGDYLTTSNISGYGTKQSDDILHSYTVAKISVDCDFLESFNNVEQPIKVTRDVDLWVKDNWVSSTEEEHCRLNECECRVMKETYYTDGTSNVCVDEYSNLESNVQSTYTEQSRQVYTRQRSIETTIDPGKPTYKMTKIERAFNAIDEDGKLVWEVADEKQSSYQLRYLDEIGNLTDKANAVYKAALVDCNFTST